MLMRSFSQPWPFGLNRKNWPDAAAALLLVLFVLVFFDIWASQTLQAWPDIWRQPFEFITNFGLSDWVLIPSLVVFVVAAIAKRLSKAGRGQRALWELSLLSGFIFLGVGVPGIIANVLKRIIGRGRPGEFAEFGAFHFERFLNGSSFQSFPSGHATTAMATAIVIGFVAPRFFHLVLIIAVMTGFSRVVIGMHYPTDVLGGFALGLLGAYAVRNFFASRRWLFARRADGTIRFRGVRHLQNWLRALRQRARA